jgi:predicted alpha-1,2-mannosidase
VKKPITARERVLSDVNPFFAINGDGSCLPGPQLPFGMARPGPDSPLPHSCNGIASAPSIRRPDLGDSLQPETCGPEHERKIARFSQNHVSGTGGDGRYGNVSLMPFVGAPEQAHAGRARLAEEAGVGYYRADLEGGIRHELACTRRAAMHRSSFSAAGPHGLVLDAGSMVKGGTGSCRPLLGFVEWISARECQGWSILKGGWGHSFPYQIHFFLRLDRTAARRSLIVDGVSRDALWADGEKVQAVAWCDEPVVVAAIGISFVSIGNARAAVENEVGARGFEEVVADADSAWERELGSIRIQASPEETGLFYSAFHRLLAMPTDLGTDENPWWNSPTKNFTDYYCFWDSVRNANSFFLLARPELQAAMLRDQLDIAAHIGWFPDAWIAGHSAQVQGGSSTDVVFAEAALKGIEGVDFRQALALMVHCAETPPEDPFRSGRYHDDYQRLGWVTPRVINCVSRHIEYAFQDNCISRLAARLGERATAERYAKESEKLWNLWRDDLRCFGPREADGTWTDFDPWKPARKDFWNDPNFYEGTGHEWALTAVHALPELVRRHGGAEAFARHLDRFFDGRIHYWKEIILHTPYLYHEAGRPDLVTKAIERQRLMYRNDRTGLPDNEDMGSQSTFVMATTLGLYPIMGETRYWLSVPRLREAEIDLPGGKLLRIVNQAREGELPTPYLDGRKLARWSVEHAEIAGGGELSFR